MLVAGIICFVLATGFLAAGLMLRNSTQGRLTAPGRITDLRYSTDREFGQIAYPELTYTLPSGQEIVAESSQIAAEDDGEVRGAEVQVRYDPDDPYKVDIDNSGSGGAWKVFVGFSVALDLAGVALIVLSAL